MSNITPFDFQGNDVRVVIDENNETWFVAKDVCDSLDYVWHSNLIKNVPDEWKGSNRITTLGGDQEMSILSEQGLYFFLGRSDKPGALPMQKWIAGEVLPSIRKTGSYSMQKPMTALELARANAEMALKQVAMLEKIEETERQRDIAIETKAWIGDRRQATAMATASHAVKKVNELKAQLDESKQYCTVKRMEMLHHGQKFDWRKVKSASAEMQIPPIDVFDANYGTVKAYHIDAWHEAYGINRRGLL